MSVKCYSIEYFPFLWLYENKKVKARNRIWIIECSIVINHVLNTRAEKPLLSTHLGGKKSTEIKAFRGWSVGWQHDFCVDDPSFLGIVFLLLVVLGKQPFAALVSCGGYGWLSVAALDDFYIMVRTGHNGFLLPVVDWMGWWFAASFWAKEKQETVSDFLLGGAAGVCSVLKVRVRLARWWKAV